MDGIQVFKESPSPYHSDHDFLSLGLFVYAESLTGFDDEILMCRTCGSLVAHKFREHHLTLHKKGFSLLRVLGLSC